MEVEAGLELEIIINPKTTDDGQAIVQVRVHYELFGLPDSSALYP
jgi:hypothetical protein